MVLIASPAERVWAIDHLRQRITSNLKSGEVYKLLQLDRVSFRSAVEALYYSPRDSYFANITYEVSSNLFL